MRREENLPKDEEFPPNEDPKNMDWDEINKFALKMYKDFSTTKGGYYDESPIGRYYSRNYFNMKIKKIMFRPINHKSLIYFWDILDDFTELNKCFIHMTRVYHWDPWQSSNDNKDIYQVLYYKLYEATLKG